MAYHPRIGITGSAGTGKTTLAGQIAAALGAPLVEEAMRRRLEQGFDFHQIDRATHRALLASEAEDLARLLAAPNPRGLVTDRTPLDMAAFWLSNGYGMDDPAATEALLARAICAMADYDAVLLLPWGGLPLEADGIRSANPWLHLHFQTVMEGLCRRWLAPDRFFILPESVKSRGARLSWVMDRLNMAVAA